MKEEVGRLGTLAGVRRPPFTLQRGQAQATMDLARVKNGEEANPEPPVSQSKQVYVEDDDFTKLVRSNGGKGKGKEPATVGWNAVISPIFAELSQYHVDRFTRRIAFRSEDERDQIRKHLKDSEEEGEEFVGAIMTTYQKKAQKDGNNLSNEVIEDGKTHCLGETSQFLTQCTIDQNKVARTLEEDPTNARGRQNREEVNRVLKAKQGGASHYELLGLPTTANK
ncbi:hypothetical protein EDB82DRAFT_479126 [Fusarium venenatum]|uniref:uncharacterized protein n=1 Tax=Fusarium venenatum TaxID=56646 RepID=UPI001D8F68DB|nr:hypothetical protein EDB82DRAFT_479126 [Fusarium venenatum]